MDKGGSRSVNRAVTVTPLAGLWQIDFRDVHWSVPGGVDVLFTVRAADRASQSCPAGKMWSLAASPAGPEYRLRLFDKDRVPAGFAEPASAAKQIRIQVWAHKYSLAQ